MIPPEDVEVGDTRFLISFGIDGDTPLTPSESHEVAFASDQDGHDFEIYMANVFTAQVQWVTDNTA
jgi:hypothetical protein